MDSFISTEGATLARDDEGAVIASLKNPDKDIYVVTGSSSLPQITAVRLDVLADKLLPHGGPGRQENGNLHLSEFEAKVFEAGAPKPTVLKFARATADFNQAGWGIERAIDGKPDTAWGIFPEVGKSHHAVFELAQPLVLKPGAKLVITLKQLHGQSHLIGRFRISTTSAPVSRVAAVPQLAAEAFRNCRRASARSRSVWRWQRTCCESWPAMKYRNCPRSRWFMPPAKEPMSLRTWATVRHASSPNPNWSTS